MIVSSRIDSRLIHGQVIEAWLPHLRVTRVVVADARTAGDDLVQAAMALAVPDAIQLVYCAPERLDVQALSGDAVPTLVLFREVEGVMTARQHGLPNGRVVLGNVHAGPGRTQLSRSVFLTDAERQQLFDLVASGMEVVVQAVPSDAATGFPRAA